MNSIVTTESLSKHYKNATALDQVSIHIPKGSIYGLVGNNGAGKTTLMRLLLGLQTPSSGQIHLESQIATGSILESPAVYPFWSAKRNLKYQISLIDNPQYGASELMQMVGLKNTKKPVIQYSLGMKQRLGLALALVNHPDLLFLDEPLNGLDPSGIRQMRYLIQSLNEKEGVTIVISSHILDELQKIVTDIGFLKDGVLIYECTRDEISEKSLEKFYFEEFEQ